MWDQKQSTGGHGLTYQHDLESAILRSHGELTYVSPSASYHLSTQVHTRMAKLLCRQPLSQVPLSELDMDSLILHQTLMLPVSQTGLLGVRFSI